MDEKKLKHQLTLDLELAKKAINVLQKSFARSQSLLLNMQQELSDDERETLESLTSRFGRALDILTQKLFRTIDRIELTDDGSVLDRINRFKKRQILQESVNYRLLKDLRNRIVHEYIIEEGDEVVKECIQYTPLLVDGLLKCEAYCLRKGFLGSV